MKKERYQQELQCKLRESLPAPRQVSPLLKVRVCDGNASAILSVWSPGEEVVDVLKEGACVSLRNVIAAGKRYRSREGVNYNVLARTMRRRH